MTVDRDQILRDAEWMLDACSRAPEGGGAVLARHCLALLAELEQAEKEAVAYREALNWVPPEDSLINPEPLDEATTIGLLMVRIRELAELEQTEARLAKVPALVEALREIAEMDPPVIAVVNGSLATRVRDALADWDAEQPGPDTTQRFVPFCEGGRATCEICVGSCGIEEYEDSLPHRVENSQPETRE